MIYANHAATSYPKPAPVLDAVARALAAPPHEWGALYERAHARIAHHLGATSGDLWLTSGCTAALAHAFTSIPFAPGDLVLTTGLEHHALSRWPLHLAATRGVRFDASPYAPGLPLDLDWLERTLARGSVRLVALAMASNVTGELVDVAAVARLARAHGALTLVDAAQVAGVAPLDVLDLGVDMLAIAGHKGPQGPHGVGALWVRDDVRVDVPAASCDTSAPSCGTSLSFCDLGSVNLAGAAGLAAGFDSLSRHGAPTIERMRPHVERVLDAVLARPELRLLGSRDARRVPTVAFTCDDPSAWQSALEARGVLTRAGFHCAPQAHQTLGCAERGSLRISLGASTSEEEVDAIVEAMADVE